MATAAYDYASVRLLPRSYLTLLPSGAPKTKTCANPLCGETLPIDDFPLCASAKDGHRNLCWFCAYSQQKGKPHLLRRMEKDRAQLWMLLQQMEENKAEERLMLNARVGKGRSYDEASSDALRGIRRSYQELWKQFNYLRRLLTEKVSELARLLFGAPARRVTA